MKIGRYIEGSKGAAISVLRGLLIYVKKERKEQQALMMAPAACHGAVSEDCPRLPYGLADRPGSAGRDLSVRASYQGLDMSVNLDGEEVLPGFVLDLG